MSTTSDVHESIESSGHVVDVLLRYQSVSQSMST